MGWWNVLQRWLAGRWDGPTEQEVRRLAATLYEQAEQLGELEERQRLHDAADVRAAYREMQRRPDDPH